MSVRRNIGRRITRLVVAFAAASVASNPTPTTSALSTSTSPRWEDDITLVSVTGTGFIASSSVAINGVTAATYAFVSSTSMTVTIPATSLYEVGTLSITVVSPGPGGGTSNAQTFTVTQPTYVQAEYRAGAGRTMNGATVSALADQSGRGDANRNLAQATATAQPTYVATDAAFNGKATFTHDGGDYMQSGTWSSSMASSRIYWVGQNTAAAAVYMFDGLATGRHGLLRSTATDSQMLQGSTLTTVSPQWDGTGKVVVVCEFNNTSSKFGKNVKTLTNFSQAGTAAMTGFTLFARNSAANIGAGTWAHTVIVNTTISAAQHANLTTYLGAEYGVTIGA